MLDLNSMPGLIPALGGSAVLGAIAKSLFDRHNESHKARLAANAKQKERYNEKRDAAIVGLFERLQKVRSSSWLYLTESSFEEGRLTEGAAARLSDALEEVEPAARELSDFFNSHVLYLPKRLASRVSEFQSEVLLLRCELRNLIKGRPTQSFTAKELEKVQFKTFETLRKLEAQCREVLQTA